MTLEAALDALIALEQVVPQASGEVVLEGNTLRIENPDAKGAMTVRMMRQLAASVIALQASRHGLLILTGTPGCFCSGGHLEQVRIALLDDGNGRLMCDAMTVVLDALLALPMIVVAVVDGPALGGGAEILTAADHRVFSPRAAVGFVHATLGVTPGWGGAARLVRAVGPTRALRWLTQARPLRGHDAVGFVDVAGEFPQTVDAFLRPLQALEPAVLSGCKRAVLAASPWVRSPKEADIFESLWGGALHRDRLGV